MTGDPDYFVLCCAIVTVILFIECLKYNAGFHNASQINRNVAFSFLMVKFSLNISALLWIFYFLLH